MSEGSRHESNDGPNGSSLGTFALDVVSIVASVALVAGLLFAISGVWPPLVAIESGSMEPHIETNDLVFVMEEHRFAGQGSYADTGVVPARIGAQTGYTTFQRPGDVIVYAPDGNRRRTPIIHRAMFWVNDSENWYDKADPAFVGGASNCRELQGCPANSSGFITKGDHNNGYDQIGPNPLSRPVKPEWIIGTAEARLPGLGNLRLSLEPFVRVLAG